MFQLWQHITREHVAFVDVRIARQYERLDTDFAIGVDFGEHLVRIADNCRAAAGTGAANAGPQIIL